MKLPPKFYQAYSYHEALGWSASPPFPTANMAKYWAKNERAEGMVTVVRLIENDLATGLHISTVDMSGSKATYLEAAE